MLEGQIHHIRRKLDSSSALLIAAGAGIGVDSGLPDFRGQDGFWKVYPPLGELGISFEEMANPRWFSDDPNLAWGFYGHRWNKYRSTSPHLGFEILRKWTRAKKSSFIFTSNVDGQFQYAGFSSSEILECHGSIHYLQCNFNCGVEIWSFPDDFSFNIDQDTFRAKEPMPRCNACGRIARPNILMFSDFLWDTARVDEQNKRFNNWIKENENNSLAIIEIGAGLTVPTVRLSCENIFRNWNAEVLFIRINPNDTDYTDGINVLKMGALQALRILDK